MSVRDELATTLAKNLNSKFKDMKVAYFLDGSDTTPTDIKDFVSTGSTMLDLAISNKKDGGIAVGRITEINGLESSGKSLLGAHILAETQNKGGVAIYIDTETAVSREFLTVIGLDVENIEQHYLNALYKKNNFVIYAAPNNGPYEVINFLNKNKKILQKKIIVTFSFSTDLYRILNY